MSQNYTPVRDELFAVVNCHNEIRLLLKDKVKARIVAHRFAENKMPFPPFRVVKVVVFEEETIG